MDLIAIGLLMPGLCVHSPVLKEGYILKFKIYLTFWGFNLGPFSPITEPHILYILK